MILFFSPMCWFLWVWFGLGGLTWVASHMVPYDQPEAALVSRSSPRFYPLRT